MIGHSFVTTPTSAVVYRLKGYAITTAKLCWTLVCEHFLVLRVNMAFWGFSHGQIISHHGYGYYLAFEVQFAEYSDVGEGNI